MTNLMTDNDKKSNLTEEDIIAWLKENPNFFSSNPDVFEYLTPPKESKGKGVADFQYYMVQRLRADRDGIIEEAREIVETSRANMNNQSRVFRSVLMLLDAFSFDEFIKIITMDMASVLDVDIIALLVESEDDVIPHINLSGVRVLPVGATQALMNGKNILITDHVIADENIFGGGAGLVKSQVLLKLNIAPDTPPAVLAFGSRNSEQFIPGQGTELISFLGHVIERYMRIWLNV